LHLLFVVLVSVGGAHEGNRNHLCFWGACRFAEMAAEGLISPNYAIELVVEAANRAGLPRSEARRTVESAFKNGKAGYKQAKYFSS
jgi:2-keto-3-deoxy-6-phosphogluconate aldolase